MTSRLNPYINFIDKTREAMEFYKTVFGGKLEFSTFKEFGMSTEPGEEEKIMHSKLEADNGIIFMAADLPKGMTPPAVNGNITMALGGDNDEELTAYFNKLSEGGTVRDQLVQAPWGDTFGSVVDKFGINWMINISAKKSEE